MAPSLLILTDFFQAANRALDYATNLARPLGARLVLLHVRRDSVLDPEMLTGKLSNLDNEALHMALNSITSDLPVPVVVEIGHGRVAYAVADTVSRHHPTLVVLGRPDTKGTPDELVSTTALDILRTAPYPMLVVPHNVSSTDPPRRVLLAVDGEAFSLGPHAGATRHLLDALHAELTVLHVEEHAGPTAATARALASVEDTGLTMGLPQPLRTRSVVAPHPAEAILQAARPEDFDLVVLIARPRSFFGELFHRSVTARVLLHSAVPVLVLPAAG
ncbi:universal stress protein [Hymenobacter sp.]|uniref:universal stress protein n=1 Tax=Hymenobacter sp. TaxID=1898978 RepID=UPI00286C4E48|nr:universal stress protein [Hymenobacter sp.]